MDNVQRSDDFARRIMDVQKKRKYADFGPVMAEIFSDRNRLEILSELANRLPSGTVHDFFLCSLSYLQELNVSDIRKLYEISIDRDMALYSLTWFFMVVANIRGAALRELTFNSAKIQGIEQFKSALSGGNHSDDERLYDHFTKVFGVKKADILTFRKKIARELES